MNTIHATDAYKDWFRRLHDPQAKERILVRTLRAEKGNFGDHKSVGDGVFEMRIAYGPGYRVYFAQKGDALYLLLIGGDKHTQERDIQKAKAIWSATGEKDHEEDHGESAVHPGRDKNHPV